MIAKQRILKEGLLHSCDVCFRGFRENGESRTISGVGNCD